MWRRDPSSAEPLQVTAKAQKPYQLGIMGRWITSLSRRPLRLQLLSSSLSCWSAPLFNKKNSVKILIVAHVFKPEMYSPMLQMIKFICHPSSLFVWLWLDFDFGVDWFRLPAAILSSSGPKYSLHRVTSDGHVVRVLLAHQECLLYGRVHWAGADLQIRGWGGGGGSLRASVWSKNT